MSDETPEEEQLETPEDTAPETEAEEERDWRSDFLGQRKVNRDLEKKLKEARDRADALEKKQPATAEPDVEAIRRQIQQETQAEVNQRILALEIKAAAAGKLADPADAHKFIDLTNFEVNDDGSVDSTEIAAALDDLLKSKPYLAAKGGSPRPGSADGGVRQAGKEGKPPQLTRENAQSMTSDAITKAKAAGQCDDLLGITH